MKGVSREPLESWEAQEVWEGGDKKMGESQMEMGTERVCEPQKVWEAQAEVENMNVWENTNIWDVQAEVDSQNAR